MLNVFKLNQNDITLHHAASNGQIAQMQLLIADGIDIHAKSEYGSTALHQAAALGQYESVKFLIDNGATTDINVPNNFGSTPLHEASESYSNQKSGTKGDIVTLLIAHGANTEIYTKSYDDGFTPLHTGLKSNNVLAVNALINGGANIHAKTKSGKTAVQVAALSRNFDLMIFLLKMGANFNEIAALMFKFIEYNQIQEVQYLLTHHYNVHQTDDIYHETPLLTAVAFLRPALVALFLNYGAKINATNNKKQTALHLLNHTRVRHADLSMRIVIAKILISQGIDMSTADHEDKTAFQNFLYKNSLKYTVRSKYQEHFNFYELLLMWIKYGYFEQVFERRNNPFRILFIHFEEEQKEEGTVLNSLRISAVIANQLYNGKNLSAGMTKLISNEAISILLNLIIAKGLPANCLNLELFFKQIEQLYVIKIPDDLLLKFDKILTTTKNLEIDLINIILKNKQSFVLNYYKKECSLYQYSTEDFFETYPEYKYPGNIIKILLTNKNLLTQLMGHHTSLLKHLEIDFNEHLMYKQELRLVKEAYSFVKKNEAITDMSFYYSAKTKLYELLTHNTTFVINAENIFWPITFKK